MSHPTKAWFKNQVTSINLKIRTEFVPSATVTFHRRVCWTANHINSETGEKFNTSYQVSWRDRHYDIITASSLRRVLRVQSILAEKVYLEAQTEMERVNHD